MAGRLAGLAPLARQIQAAWDGGDGNALAALLARPVCCTRVPIPASSAHNAELPRPKAPPWRAAGSAGHALAGADGCPPVGRS